MCGGSLPRKALARTDPAGSWAHACEDGFSDFSSNKKKIRIFKMRGARSSSFHALLPWVWALKAAAVPGGDIPVGGPAWLSLAPSLA